MRPPLISTDTADLLLYWPPGVTLTVAFFQFLPLTSTPWLFSCATAALARSSRYAPDGAFLITLNCLEILAVRSNAALSMIPMPLLFGQMSALISFICHVWWPLSSVGPCLRTMFTQSFAWSRQ